MDHIGIDVDQKESQICILADGGELIEQRIRTGPERFAAVLGDRPRGRILLEASTEREWVARCLEGLDSALACLARACARGVCRRTEAHGIVLREDGLAITILELRVEVERTAADLPDRANQTMAASPVEREIDREGGEEDDDQADAQLGCRLHDGMADEKAEPNPRASPRQSAHGAAADKAGHPHLRRAGQSRSDRVQLRQKPGTELKCPGAGGGEMLNTVNQPSGMRREAAEHLEDWRAAPSAQAVPSQIRGKRCGDHDTNDHGHAQVAVPCQRARAKQGGDHGHRYASLVTEDPGEQIPFRMLQHYLSPSPRIWTLFPQFDWPGFEFVMGSRSPEFPERLLSSKLSTGTPVSRSGFCSITKRPCRPPPDENRLPKPRA